MSTPNTPEPLSPGQLVGLCLVFISVGFFAAAESAPALFWVGLSMMLIGAAIALRPEVMRARKMHKSRAGRPKWNPDDDENFIAHCKAVVAQQRRQNPPA